MDTCLKHYDNRKKLRIVMILFIIANILVLQWLAVNTAVYGDTSYTTERFDVTVNVHEDNTITVTEEIVVNFTYPAHGIYHYIPKEGKAYFEKDGEKVEINRNMDIVDVGFYQQSVTLDGTGKYVKNLDSSGINYDGEYYEDNGNTVIKIGSAERYLEGLHKYTISYTCVCYEDGIDAYDFFYFNVLPPRWESPIANSTITVNMPKPVDGEQLWVYRGEYGSYMTEPANLAAGGKTMELNFANIGAYEGITVHAYMPEGYWVGEKDNSWAIGAGIVTILLTVLLVAGLWVLFGRDKKLIKPVEFYAPDGLAPAEVGYIIDGAVDKEDIVSMVLYFADKGYLTIEEKTQRASGISGLFGKEERVFTLIKQGELPPDIPMYQISIFEGLFGNSDHFVLGEYNENFAEYYRVAMEQLTDLYKLVPKKRLFTKSSTITRGLAHLLAGIPLLLAVMFTNIAAYNYNFGILMMIPFVMCSVGCMAFVELHDKKYNMSNSKKLAKIIFGAIFVGVSALITFGLCGETDYSGIVIVIAIAASVANIVFARIMQKRTERGTDILGRILGFKEFIRVAEKDRIEKLAKDNPSYFYDVLPYAYIFGLSDVWAKQFESISTELRAPDWYAGTYSNSLFNVMLFSSMMNSCTTSISESLNVPSASSGDFHGGGGFGGGGFSGGGFGGGGGGAW